MRRGSAADRRPLGFGADATLFRSGWFLESILTELAVLFVLRTRRPFLRSRPSALLAASSLGLAVVTLAIIYGPLGSILDPGPLPPAILGSLVGVTAAYVAATEVAKRVFYARQGQLMPSGPLLPDTRL